MSLSVGLRDIGREALSQALTEQPTLMLRWYSYGIVLQKQTEHGVAEYAVSPEDVATALSNTVVFDTGLLTTNTLCVRVEGARRIIVEYRRRQKTPLWLEGSDDVLHVPLPALILIRVTTANRDPNYHVYAVEERPTGYDAPLYHAPLPNVYTSGSICWGTVVKPDMASNNLSADWTQLLSTRFGSHSVSGKCQSHPRDVRKLYLAMEKRRTRVFPSKELIPARRTLSSVIGVEYVG